MKTKKDDTEAEARKMVAPLANKLVKAKPEVRSEAVRHILATALPMNLRILAEVLIHRLDSKSPQVQDGAALTLAALGPRIVRVVEWALWDKPTEARLLKLAPVCVALSRHLTDSQRMALQCCLRVAEGRAKSLSSAVAMCGP